jgi:hypothetical protein
MALLSPAISWPKGLGHAGADVVGVAGVVEEVGEGVEGDAGAGVAEQFAVKIFGREAATERFRFETL